MRTRNRLLPMAVAALVGVALTGAGCARHSNRPGSAAPPGPSASPSGTASAASPGSTPRTSPTPRPERWQQIAAAPVAGGDYYNYQAVWTGTHILVHQPDYSTGRGAIDAAFDPATGRWRRLPSGDLPVQTSEAGPQVVWDGAEMLTFGVFNAAYDPAGRTWRKLTPPPMGGPSAVVWTGSRVLIWGGGCCDDESNHGASYDPNTNRWTPLPTAPLAPRHANGVWTGRELIIIGGEAHGQTVYADAAAYNPATRTWRKLPPLPAPRMNATLTWTGQDVMVVGGERAYGAVPWTTAYAYRPATNRWRRLPPLDVGRSAHVAVWTGSRLIVWGGYTRGAVNAEPTKPAHGLILDPVAGRWSPMPEAPILGRRDATAFWTGSRMLIWGGYTVGDNPTGLLDGASYRAP